MDSFVTIEASKISGESIYSDGVVIANNGYYYYVITDGNVFSALKGQRDIRYKVKDSKASEYDAIAASVMDEESGLLLLRVNLSGEKDIAMKEVSMGDISSLVGHISNIEQINKLKLIDNIKTNTIIFDDVSFNSYILNDNSTIKGAIISRDNKLCGIYLSKYNSYVEANLIRYILKTTYSLDL